MTIKTKVAIAICAGPLVTVGVAWACLHWQSFALLQNQRHSISPWLEPAPLSWPPPEIVWNRSVLGASYFHAKDETGAYPLVHHQIVIAAGLPFRALRSSRFRELASGPTLGPDNPRDWLPIAGDGGIAVKSWNPLIGVLPTQPIWTGFAADWVTFSMVVFGLLSLTELGRLRRRRLGLCLSCGHPLMAATVCPECGRPTPSPRVAA